MRVVILIVSLVLSVAAIFGCLALNGYGFILAPLENDEIAHDTRVNQISKSYTGMKADELADHTIEESYTFVVKFSNWYSRKTAKRAWEKNPEKFTQRYESCVKYLAQLGSVNYSRLVIYGFWGIGFITIVIVLLHSALSDDEIGLGYYITSMGEIARDTGGDLWGTIGTIIVVVGLALLVAPGIPFLSLILSVISLFFW